MPGKVHPVCQGVGGRHCAQPGGVEVAGERGIGEGAQPFGLDLGQPGYAGQVAECAGGGEGGKRRSGDGEVLAVPLGGAFLDRGGLGDPDAVPDDRPGGGLVGGAEAHRPQPRVSGCEPGHDRVGFSDLRKSAAVDVE